MSLPPIYRLAQTFLRREAVPASSYTPHIRGGARNEPADPASLTVVLASAIDRTQIVEQIASPHPRIYRLVTGTWAYEVPYGLCQPAQPYIAQFVYQFQGGNQQASFQTFYFNAVPERPRQPDHCIVYDLLADGNGVPYSNQQIVFERYLNVVTLNKRIDTTTVQSDPFGLWWVELPVGTVTRVVVGELTKVIIVPEGLDRVALSTLQGYQPREIDNVDSFGYPKPFAVNPNLVR